MPGIEFAEKYTTLLNAKFRTEKDEHHQLKLYRGDITKSQHFCINQYLAWASKHIEVGNGVRVDECIRIFTKDPLALESATLFRIQALYKPPYW